MGATVAGQFDCGDPGIGLAGRSEPAILRSMGKGWILVVVTPRLGGQPNFEPLRECFLVGAVDSREALRILRERNNVDNAEYIVAGEATAQIIDHYALDPGDVKGLP
jgi:hypothetical protein